MPKEFKNPDGLNKPIPYTHTVTVTGDKIAFISGQIALDEANNLVGRGDFRAQLEQVFRNLTAAAQGVGGTLADIVKINVYIVNYDRERHYELLGEVREKYFGDHAPVSTLIGVQALASDGFLVEIEAVVVID
jgi:enamine deaminase RidA (YjgF/YER057c/UK114 family)